MLVRDLIPEAVPGNSAEDGVTAAVPYDLLERPRNNVRLRMGSTVLRVKHPGNVATAKQVEVACVNGGKLQKATAAHCIPACRNMVIPFLSDEFSPRQHDVLVMTAKVPGEQANAALRNRRLSVKTEAWQVRYP
jgi:spermidine dehydrogenase